MTALVPSAPRGGLRRLVPLLVGLAISVAGLWLVFQGIDPAAIGRLFAAVSPLPLLAALALIPVQLAVRSLRWSFLLPPVAGRPRVPAGRLVPVILVGYLANAVLPARLGDPLRAFLVARREDIPASGALASVVVERAMDVLVLALLLLPAVALAGAPGWVLQASFAAAALSAGLLLVAQTPLPRRAVAWVRSSLGPERLPRWGVWLDRADRFVAAMDGSGRRRAFGAALGLTAVSWLLDGAIYWCVAASLGIGLAPAGAIIVSAITVLGTAIPSAPGYLGTYELAASTVARALGVAADAALAFALLAHAVTVLPLALAGAAALPVVGGSRRTSSQAAPVSAAPASRGAARS